MGTQRLGLGADPAGAARQMLRERVRRRVGPGCLSERGCRMSRDDDAGSPRRAATWPALRRLPSNRASIGHARAEPPALSRQG
jgi:hypothetical protein